ncbi:hypothetical protein LCGC14_2292930 [marine sediment metagenome]|uniref:Uncharacterized protein n=1 Tax=marine sediment metagenome TaxID=412755 RepID=A0A0F9CRA1_9ZZZZ
MPVKRKLLALLASACVALPGASARGAGKPAGAGNAPGAVRVFDTGVRSPGPIPPRVLARRAGWTELRPDGAGKFTEVGLLTGLAYDLHGIGHGTMAVECASRAGECRPCACGPPAASSRCRISSPTT